MFAAPLCQAASSNSAGSHLFCCCVVQGEGNQYIMAKDCGVHRFKDRDSEAFGGISYCLCLRLAPWASSYEDLRLEIANGSKLSKTRKFVNVPPSLLRNLGISIEVSCSESFCQFFQVEKTAVQVGMS